MPSFYVTGGTMRPDARSYVVRRADDDLRRGLEDGEFCYVLTSRQMGKSSLMVRTAAALRAAGATVVVVDLTALGQNVTPEQWYDGLLNRIGQQLDLEEELEAFWLRHDRTGPLQRWTRGLCEVVLPQCQGPLVIFVDEIDAVRSLPFATDEFFAAIREFCNRRSEDPALDRLAFCLLGVATPAELIRDPLRTPFHVGRRIELRDFAPSEAQPLAEGLGRAPEIAFQLLQRVLYWTGGHPYLTQRFCSVLATDTTTVSTEDVDRTCARLFLSPRAREQDDNLLFVRERLLRGTDQSAALLRLYAQIHSHGAVHDDEANETINLLALSGITRAVNGLLHVRNRIYHQVFDQRWVEANLPQRIERREAARTARPTRARRSLSFLRAIGRLGNGPGEFRGPQGVALDRWGNLYVADTLNHRIQRIAADGDILRYEKTGRQPGELSYPTAVLVDQQLFLSVLDAGNCRVQRFTPTWQLAGSFGSPGSQMGCFRSPASLAQDRFECVYVCDTGNSRVQKFALRGNWVAAFPALGSAPAPFRPTAAATDMHGSLLVADAATNRIVIFNSHGGRIGTLAAPGRRPGELNDPRGIVVGLDGTLFVSDVGNARVQALSPAGECLAVFGEAAGEPDEIGEPHALAVDAESHVYIADAKLHRITVLAWV